MIELKHKSRFVPQPSRDKLTSDPFDDSHLYLGLSASRGMLAVSPELERWVGRQLSEEYMAIKERRKAFEALKGGPTQRSRPCSPAGPGQPAGAFSVATAATRQPSMAVGKELLPCPLPFSDNSPVLPGSLSRGTLRRLRRNRSWKSWCNEGVATINRLFSGGASSEAPLLTQASLAQRSCLDRLARHYRDVGPPPADVPPPAGAFAELCGSRPGYSEATSQDAGIRSPYREGDVSLPTAGSEPADPSSLLGYEDRLLWEGWREHILRPELDAAAARQQQRLHKAYSDPALVCRPRVYSRFLKQLCDAKVCTLRPFREATVGIFFVTKKLNRLRLIFDTRLVNLAFTEPPHTDLPSAGAWGRVEVKRGDVLYISQSDVADAFYRIKLPPGLSDMFVLPRVPTKSLSFLSAEARASLGEFCSPTLDVLPMGWSWALHFCQRVVEGASLRAGLDPKLSIRDRGSPPPKKAS